jgi:hypothetical protein
MFSDIRRISDILRQGGCTMNVKVEKTIRDIDFSMTMENMPLNETDKQRLRDCMTGKTDIYEVLSQTIAKHSQINTLEGI